MSRRHFYSVKVYDASDLIATWERLADSKTQAVDQGLTTARIEFPVAENLEVFAEYIESVR